MQEDKFTLLASGTPKQRIKGEIGQGTTKGDPGTKLRLACVDFESFLVGYKGSVKKKCFLI